MSQKVKIIGYYGHYNAGDEQYKITLNLLFKDIETEYIDCDMIQTHVFDDNDIIIIGGGDILNSYFLEKISLYFTDKPNVIIAVSVGLPYVDVLTSNNTLDIIDHFFIRTKQDMQLFSRVLCKNKISYIPDASTLYNYSSIPANTTIPEKSVCFCLSRHIYSEQYPNEYNAMIEGFKTIVEYFQALEYTVVFLPFNTNQTNSTENDILIANDVISKVQSTTNIINITETYSLDNIIAVLKKVKLCIPMRFHACLFSIYTSTPFIPIYTTRKIQNLLLDVNWNYGIKLTVNEDDIPTGINTEAVISQSSTIGNRLDNQETFNIMNSIFSEDMKTAKACVLSRIKNGKGDTNTYINEVYDYIMEYANQKGYESLAEITEDSTKETIVKMVSYKLLDVLQSQYNYGLKEKMFSPGFNYRAEWGWILSQQEKKSLTNLKLSGLFNMKYINQEDTSGSHRSGWQYVYEGLEEHHGDIAPIYLDMYVDRTFHWDREINRVINIIPYTKPWIGFIHHTFDTSFSEYNCITLLQCKEFRDSLPYCKALIVLSYYLKQQLKTSLASLGYNNIDIYNLVHPTETNVKQFNINKFVSNPDKKLIHVGGWLRNVYSFYNITMPVNEPLSKNTKLLRKVALKGKNMNNYYPSEDILEKLLNALKVKDYQYVSGKNCSTNDVYNNIIVNNWNKHFFEDMSLKISNIDFITHLDNDKYDDLLSENIVFINLIDASAVNTVIECIVRRTPIVVNSHPAVVELLGAGYPLFYNESKNYSIMNVEINELLETDFKIRKAFRYLKKIDITPYKLNTFVSAVTTIINSVL